MNHYACYLAVAKAYEARDKLRAAQTAVETLSDLALVPGLQPQLEAILEALTGHSAQLETYTEKLRDGDD